MVLIPLLQVICTAVVLVHAEPEETCRIIQFVRKVNEKALEGQTISTINSNNVDFCEIQCFLNHDCVSYNFGPTEDNADTYVCELNNSTDNKRLKPKAMYVYSETEDSCRSNPCLNNGKCQYGFTVKTFRCLCTVGFTGELCDRDIDECSNGSHDCDVNANCTNTNGSYSCTCNEGYSGKGESCQDIDECLSGSHACNVTANCTNTDGSHNCTCKEGYTGDGQSCQDINECSGGNHVCDVNSNCNNTEGSHICTCKEGYTGDGQSCQDIDECNNGSHDCDVNANCTNTNGSHSCTCKEGYTGKGESCQADPCYNYRNLSEANRKSSYVTPHDLMLCDNSLPEGWYRFVGAAGTKMPTTRVPAFRCGTDWSGWLAGSHPTMEDGEVLRMVCFSDRPTGCKSTIKISVQNCGSFYIYKFAPSSFCNSRYCGTD